MTSMSAGSKEPQDESIHMMSSMSEIKNALKTYSTRQSTMQFIGVVNNLTAEQREEISAIGFGHLLELKCSFTPKALVYWLVTRFDCTSKSIKFSNGSSFKLDAVVVQKILGIPHGDRKIHCKPTCEASAFIKKETKCSGDSPTITELVSNISNLSSGHSFVRSFMLVALATFLCPTTHGHASAKYFEPLLVIDEIVSYDWSQLVLDWLVSYINRFQQKISIGKSPALGGCTFFLVVCYLEFLKAPQVDFGISCPRLKFWSTSNVSYVTTLDMFPGFPPQFGRLALKEISSTPFCEMEASFIKVVDSINANLFKVSNEQPCQNRDSVKRKLSEISSCVESTIFEAIRPVVSSLAMQILQIIEKDGHISNPSVNISSSAHTTSLAQGPHFVQNSTSCLSESDDEHTNQNNIRNDGFAVMVFNPPHFPDSRVDALSEMMNMLQILPVPEICCEFESRPDNVEYDDLFRLAVGGHISCNVPDNQSDPFPSGYDVLSENIQSPKNLEQYADTSFLDAFKATTGSFSIVNSVQKGMSLNERMRQMFPDNYIISSPPEYSMDPSTSFDLITACCDSPICDSEQDNSQYSAGIGSFPCNDVRHIAPSQTLAQSDFITPCQPIGQSVGSSFIKCSEMVQQESDVAAKKSEFSASLAPVHDSPVICASEAEKFFFDRFTSNIQNNTRSEHIFQVDDVWIDKRTLALSMRAGCWFNEYAMFSFCKMFNSEQEDRLKLRQRNPGEFVYFFFNKNTMEMLMSVALLHNDVKFKFSHLSLGVKLDNVDFVFMPCVHNHQWFVIVANFSDNKFHILNSDNSTGDYEQKISNVIYNFKCLFLLAYPRCVRFNIRDFPVIYMAVPKQKFRYDSGIFAIRFMQTYDGTNVQNITNADLLPLRQKLLFQLLSYKYNKFSSKFIELLI